MRTLLERAFAHLLNGDDEKADALFHRFILERARQVHESLRQGDDSELDENWDSEIKEEEYFGDDDLADDDLADAGADVEAAGDDMAMAGDDMAAAGDDVDADVDADADADVDADDEFGGEGDLDGEESVEDKIDDLTDKIDALVAEFDRVMSDMDDEGDEFDTDVEDVDSDVADMDADVADADADVDADVDANADTEASEDDDLAGRMEDDMGDDEPVAESEDMGDDVDDADTDLEDITESVLAELEKVAAPSNSEGKDVGSSSAPSQKLNPNRTSPLPHHNVMDRMKGEPVMTKGPTHQGYEREAAPPVKGPEGVVSDVRKGNRRKSFKDTMGTVPEKGDASANLNSDFAGGPKPTRSITDGKKNKG